MREIPSRSKTYQGIVDDARRGGLPEWQIVLGVMLGLSIFVTIAYLLPVLVIWLVLRGFGLQPHYWALLLGWLIGCVLFGRPGR